MAALVAVDTFAPHAPVAVHCAAVAKGTAMGCDRASEVAIDAMRRFAMKLMGDLQRRGLCVVVLVAVGCAAEPTGQAGGAGAASQIGVTVQALGNKPHSSCTSATHDGHGYWFCPTNASWSTAKAACEATGVDTKLVTIDTAAENAFVKRLVEYSKGCV
jgi:hypothetical protein